MRFTFQLDHWLMICILTTHFLPLSIVSISARTAMFAGLITAPRMGSSKGWTKNTSKGPARWHIMLILHLRCYHHIWALVQEGLSTHVGDLEKVTLNFRTAQLWPVSVSLTLSLSCSRYLSPSSKYHWFFRKIKQIF